MNKIDEAFGAAWAAQLGDDPAIDPKEIVRNAFVAGAQAFSTMPLCKHGSAIWGVEHCADCEDAPGEFPGYNRPFDLGPVGPAGPTGLSDPPGPQGISDLQLDDLRAEHAGMRLSLLHALVKIGVIDEESVNAPWDPVGLIRFTGLWLSDAFPWVKQGKTHRGLTAALRSVGQRVGALETKVASLCEKNE